MPTLREKLKSATAADHRRVEESLRVVREDATLDVYVEYIERTWQYFAAVEPLLHSRMRSTPLGAIVRERSRLPWLDEDLRYFRKTASQRGVRVPITGESSAAQALGCCYVLEGSSLGGAVLYSKFAARWNIGRGSGATFLYGYGSATGGMWKAFVAGLDAVALAPAEEAACIEAARATFQTIEACYGGSPQAPDLPRFNRR